MCHNLTKFTLSERFTIKCPEIHYQWKVCVVNCRTYINNDSKFYFNCTWITHGLDKSCPCARISHHNFDRVLFPKGDLRWEETLNRFITLFVVTARLSFTASSEICNIIRLLARWVSRHHLDNHFLKENCFTIVVFFFFSIFICCLINWRLSYKKGV